MRIDQRENTQMRQVSFEPNYTVHAEGSVLVSFGYTKVICTASVENSLPKWLQGKGNGWVTAEYSMLPRSTHTRIHRDKANNSGRTQEISRLIGRSLRAVVNMAKLGERQIIVDCDVLQADGGTRTAAISGGFVALALACKKLMDQGLVKEMPIETFVAAVSTGMKNNYCLVDLCYEEDVSIDTDMNFVITADNKIVEVQGTAEDKAFSREDLNTMLDGAINACQYIFQQQKEIVGDFLKGD